jgi:hypothetical protein
MLFMIGIMWAVGFSAYRLADRLPKSLEGKHLTIEGYVIGLPSHDDRRTRFDFLVSKPSHEFP